MVSACVRTRGVKGAAVGRSLDEEGAAGGGAIMEAGAVSWEVNEEVSLDSCEEEDVLLPLTATASSAEREDSTDCEPLVDWC